MKLFKNLFNGKKDKNSKNDPNTLAEANGSPDMRLATKKEKEESVPKIKKEETKKEPKISTLTPQDLLNITAKKEENKKSEAVSSTPAVTSTAENTAAIKTNNKAPKNTAVASPKNDKKEAPKNTSKPANAVKKNTDKPAAESKKDTVKADEKKTEVKPTASSNKKSPDDKSTADKKDTKTEAAEEVTVTKSARTGKFEIKKSKDGRFVFNLYASNNVIVATSQIYSSSTSAMNGIKSVIANASTAPIEDQTLKNATTVPFPKWEIYLDKGEQYRFRLCASNGSCVCHSQGYTSKTNCKKGIESIIKFASDAEIVKTYLDKKDK